MILKRGDSGVIVKEWQKFLNNQKILVDEPDGKFGPKTEAATVVFQGRCGLTADGKAGNNTLAKAAEFGFKFGNKVAGEIRNDVGIMKWIKSNLGQIILSVAHSYYTEDLLAGICARETGFLFAKYHNQGKSFEEICSLMKGDYSQRPGEQSKRYHGFGFWQIDIASYPNFVNSGAWTDPLKTVEYAVEVLKEKRAFLIGRGWNLKLGEGKFIRAMTAAYNCGQGNVDKALYRGLDVDRYTFNGNYSKEVFRYGDIYKNLYKNL